MAVLTMGVSAALSRATLTAKNVLLISDRLKMSRIDAASNSAKVVDHGANRNGAAGNLKGNPVCGFIFPAGELNPAISIAIQAAQPEETS